MTRGTATQYHAIGSADFQVIGGVRLHLIGLMDQFIPRKPNFVLFLAQIDAP